VLTEFWAEALRVHWGIEAVLERLDGEYDLNFLARARNGQDYVLKVMRPGCEAGLVEMQVAALDHIAEVAPGLPFPKVFAALDGAMLP